MATQKPARPLLNAYKLITRAAVISAERCACALLREQHTHVGSSKVVRESNHIAKQQIATSSKDWTKSLAAESVRVEYVTFK